MAGYIAQLSRGICGALCIAASSFSAAAAAGQDNNNILERIGAPSEDRLVIEQSTDGGHVVHLDLQHEQSVLLQGNWMRDTGSLLRPGRITQTGSSHILTASFGGIGHQFAARQTGHGHRAFVHSEGRANIVSIAQAGNGNHAGVTQNGARNSIVISQN